MHPSQRGSVRHPLRGLAGVLLLAVAVACGSDSGGLDVEKHLPAARAIGRVPLEGAVDVQVAGREFTTVCAGSGPETVMLVSGQRTPMTTWEPVQVALASVARVCAYDRLGIGWSDPLRGVQTLADMAVDLEGVMTALDLDRPVTLVGHSLGGAVAMTWAADNPEDAQGVVLVDSSSARFVEREMQLSAGSDEPLSSPVYAEALQAATEDVLGNPERLDQRASWLSFAELPSLEGVPLIVLARGRAEPLVGFPEETWPELEVAHQEGQREFLSKSSNSQLYKVDDAGHFIQDDRPDVVIASVLALHE